MIFELKLLEGNLVPSWSAVAIDYVGMEAKEKKKGGRQNERARLPVFILVLSGLVGLTLLPAAYVKRLLRIRYSRHTHTHTQRGKEGVRTRKKGRLEII